MSRLRWHLATTGTYPMSDLWQHVKPYGQFVLFGEYSVGYCPPPKPRGRSTPNLLRDYDGRAIPMRPDDRMLLHILAPVVKKPIPIWPAWATFAASCVQHGLVDTSLPEPHGAGLASEVEGMWMRDDHGWHVVGPTKRNKTTLYHANGDESIITGNPTLYGLLDVDSLVSIVWSMLLNHQPIVNGLALPDRRIPDHVIEAYYETHPYKKRAKAAAAD